MPKPIIFYTSVTSYSAAYFLQQLADANGDEVELCISSEGGYTDYAMGMVEKWKSYTGKKNLIVHGMAHSVMAVFMCFTSGARALETATFVLHRAHYPEWYEQSDRFTQDLKDDLARWNAFARKTFEAKIDAEKFEELKGISLKEIFTAEKVLDVRLTAKEAKQVGLIDTIVKLTPEIKAEISNHMKAQVDGGYQRMVAIVNEPDQPQPEKINQKNKIMTVEEYKAAHPAEYAKAVAVGVAKERDRVGALMVYNDIDPEGVKAIVKSGEDITQTQMAEFNRKMMDKKTLGAIQKDSKGAVETTADEGKDPKQTSEEAKKAEFNKKLNARLNLPEGHQ